MVGVKDTLGLNEDEEKVTDLSGGLKNQLGTCQPEIRNHLMENDTVQPSQNIARQASTSHGQLLVPAQTTLLI
ncbi:hypothetical protein V6N12_002781 [Hibiscus sabdariffa]|uniref:Uncharacterized protein n=1 Tax=Hibiscus sabdariffa TaxID=183260 RepID=A0ABR2EAD5_9ROSI